MELLGELRQAVEELFDDNDTEALSASLATEGFDDELESDVLQDVVKQLVLDNGTEQFGNLFQVLLRILVQETVLIKQTVKHASVDLLLLDDLRLFEVLHGHDQLLNTAIDFIRLCREDVLEVVVGCLVDLLCVLSWDDLAREQNGILSHQVLNLNLSFLRNIVATLIFL